MHAREAALSRLKGSCQLDAQRFLNVVTADALASAAEVSLTLNANKRTGARRFRQFNIS